MRLRRMIACCVAAIAVSAMAGDAVEPAMITITNFRGEAVAQVSGTYYKDTTLRFTNCVLYAGTDTNSAVQNLDGVTVTVSAGSATTNWDYIAYVTSTNPGAWYCDITVPSFVSTPSVQVKITDESTNSYIYPWKQLNTKDGM